MLRLSELKPYTNTRRRRKVVGRGLGSGHGTYSGRGAKGQKARAGSSIPIGFEGGRMPLQRQIPKKRGFTSRSPKPTVLNLAQIEAKFSAGNVVNPRELFNKGLVKSAREKVKILSEGQINKSLTFEKISLSKPAQQKIEKAGGKIVNV